MRDYHTENFFKRHLDTFVILATFAGALLWMNGKFNDIEKDTAVIKAVLIMRNIMPAELAKHYDKE